MFSVQFQELLSYQQNKWNEAASNRWMSLCTDLRDYRAPCRSLAINKERKWELVSAFQKSIRRVDKQVGLALLKRLVRGVEGAEGIKELFQQNRIKSAHRALGEALFFVEGGRIQGELIYEPLRCLEQRLFAYQFGLPLNSWSELRVLVEKAVQEGLVDRVREEVLHQFYDPDFCNQLHEQRALDL